MSQTTDVKPKILKPGGPSGPNGGWSGGDSWGRGNEFPIPAAKMGLWLLLAAIIVMFGGFTSAYIVRSGADDWRPVPQLPILWFNTVILLLSSVALHRGLTLIRNKWGQDKGLARWLLIAVVLGVIFLAGQFAAWKQLAHRGVFVQTNPASSFFYLLTAMHGFHLLGGLGFLTYVWNQAARHRYTPKQHLTVELCATYWHFMDGLWLYLFIFLFVVRG